MNKKKKKGKQNEEENLAGAEFQYSCIVSNFPKALHCLRHHHMIFAMLNLSLPAGLAVGLDGSLPYFGTSEVYRGASDIR
jgi:hypothetical protein